MGHEQITHRAAHPNTHPQPTPTKTQMNGSRIFRHSTKMTVRIDQDLEKGGSQKPLLRGAKFGKSAINYYGFCTLPSGKLT